jgi:2-polyprenyl-3-methyl-5-hydroxy-6-metoxy-1,4-benzoquinol methylase
MEILVESGQAISQFFRDHGYTEESFSRLGLADFPWQEMAERSNSWWTVACDARLNLLIRLFYLGRTVATSQGQRVIPKEILRDLFAIGILEQNGERLQSTCLLIHFGELILACDSRRYAAAGAADLVLGVNQTTWLLGRCSMLRPGGRALDLGTGCGTLALAAASRAESVIGTDINPRALDFCRINAALNGIRNVSFLQGDRFEPIAGRRFDSIICNPPFFLAPVSGLLYCDNSMEMDGFVESLARSAPQFLQENGVFQMLCEWVEFESESWDHRLRPWFEQSHCDVHIWLGYELRPAEYARKRALELAQLRPEVATASFEERISYLSRRRVKGIFGGLISMRRRSGKNWFCVEEMQKQPAGPIGDALHEQFSVRDILESSHEPTLLASRPRLAAEVRLVSEAVPRNGAWSFERSYLERADDLPAKLALDAVVAQLVVRFDGTKTLETLLKELALEQGGSAGPCHSRGFASGQKARRMRIDRAWIGSEIT